MCSIYMLNIDLYYCCRKGDRYQGLKLGSCLTLGNELSEETHVLTKQEILLGKGSREESSRVRRTALAYCLGFYGDGISFQVVFSQSFWLRALPGGAPLFSQDGCQRKGFWEVVRHVASPFDLSWTLLVGGSLLVPCSLPGPPVIK